MFIFLVSGADDKKTKNGTLEILETTVERFMFMLLFYEILMNIKIKQLQRKAVKSFFFGNSIH